jgi:hypothetical protein
MRRLLPVVVAAPADVSSPGSRFGLVPLEDLVDAVEQAAAAVLPEHTSAVLDEARRLAGETTTASVTRSGDGVKVVIDLPEGIDGALAEAIAVRAQGAIRRIDPFAATVDVRIGTRVSPTA